LPLLNLVSASNFKGSVDSSTHDIANPDPIFDFRFPRFSDRVGDEVIATH
jgi:hypothetical protein